MITTTCRILWIGSRAGWPPETDERTGAAAPEPAATAATTAAASTVRAKRGAMPAQTSRIA